MSSRADHPIPEYLQAREAWHHNWYRVASNARNWRIFAGCLLLANLSLCALIWHLADRRATYIVEVDRHGHAVAFGPVSQLQVPEERLWRYFLSSFITQIRTIPSDRAVLESNLVTASSFLRGEALTSIRAYFEDANPWRAQKSTRVSVKIDSVLRIDRTHWRVEWTESRQDTTIAQIREERWQALITTSIQPPKSTELLLKNPLGYYVEHLDWTRLTSARKEPFAS